MKLRIEPWPVEAEVNLQVENFYSGPAELAQANQPFSAALRYVVDIAGTAIRLPEWGKDVALVTTRVSQRREALVWLGACDSKDVTLTAEQLMSNRWELWSLMDYDW